jgi:hypothetical protein
MFLWDRTFGSFGNDVSLGSSLDGWDNINVVKYRPDQVNSAQCFPVEQPEAIPYHDDLLIPILKQSIWLLTMYVTRKQCDLQVELLLFERLRNLAVRNYSMRYSYDFAFVNILER